MKDIKPLLIAMLAIGLTGTWAYHLYDKTQYSKIRNTVLVKDSAAIANAVRDSLNTAFIVVQETLDARLDSSLAVSDSMRVKLKSRVREINRLKNEISNILSRQSVTKEDLAIARAKIEELQTSVNGLTQQNQSMEAEKKELQAMLAAISRNADSLEQNINRLSQENAVLAEKISRGSYFIASDIRLSALTTKNKRDQETATAARADKLRISFAIQNNINDYSNEEMYLVIIKPDKSVMQNIDWNSSTFQTSKGQAQAYTRVIRVDYEHGEKKEMMFILGQDGFDKGTYVANLWHRGTLIAQASATLN